MDNIIYNIKENLITSILLLIILFFLLREIRIWYWKINNIVNKLSNIDDSLMMLNWKLDYITEHAMKNDVIRNEVNNEVNHKNIVHHNSTYYEYNQSNDFKNDINETYVSNSAEEEEGSIDK